MFGNFDKILNFFDENSIEKLNFLFFYFIFYFFENLLLKIEISEITPFFYKKIFCFGAGGFPPLPPPWLRPCYAWEVLFFNLLYSAFLHDKRGFANFYRFKLESMCVGMKNTNCWEILRNFLIRIP